MAIDLSRSNFTKEYPAKPSVKLDAPSIAFPSACWVKAFPREGNAAAAAKPKEAF
jgi:hypothetical protein